MATCKYRAITLAHRSFGSLAYARRRRRIVYKRGSCRLRGAHAALPAPTSAAACCMRLRGGFVPFLSYAMRALFIFANHLSLSARVLSSHAHCAAIIRGVCKIIRDAATTRGDNRDGAHRATAVYLRCWHPCMAWLRDADKQINALSSLRATCMARARPLRDVTCWPANNRRCRGCCAPSCWALFSPFSRLRAYRNLLCARFVLRGDVQRVAPTCSFCSTTAILTCLCETMLANNRRTPLSSLRHLPAFAYSLLLLAY